MGEESGGKVEEREGERVCGGWLVEESVGVVVVVGGSSSSSSSSRSSRKCSR